MYTLPKALLVREELLRRKLYIFTLKDFKRFFKASDDKIKYFLENKSNEGLFIRLKKGLYALKTDLPSEEEIANYLYQPSYISFEYALASYGILPEMTYSVTSATTKPTRTFYVEEKTFSYLTIKRDAYTGYSLFSKDDKKSNLIAEPEKALVDYLYFVVLGKKRFNDRLNISFLNKNKVLNYAKLYKRKKLIKIIKEIFNDD